MSGRFARVCRRRIESARSVAASILVDYDLEGEWNRLKDEGPRIEENIRTANGKMARRMDAAQEELEHRFGRSDLPDDKFESALGHARRISAIANDYANTVSGIHEEYRQLCARRAACIGLRRKLWKAHFQLFCVGAYVSGADFPANYVGCHRQVDGDLQTQVKFGTYVHVDGGVVYSNGCMPRIDGIEYDDDVPYGRRGGIIEVRRLVGRVDPRCSKFSAIVWGKSYDRASGLDDDEYVSDGETYDHHLLHYDLVILGSSGVFLYDQWDVLYSPLREYARRNMSYDDATIDTALDSSDDDDDV
jgi:hypothetical protein